MDVRQLNDTKLTAAGKWRGILKHLGFTEEQLNGQHQSCPICGGTDRFRYTDYKDNGDYFCSGCGNGDGFDLIMGVNGWEFKYAAKEVDKALGNDLPQEFAPKIDVEKRRRDLNAVWRGATEPVILKDYLASRGIKWDVICNDLRGHPSLFMKGSNEKHRGVLALVRNSKGIPVSIHRTYVEKRIRKVMPPTEKIAGAAIRLGAQGGDVLIVGEGIETTLSGMQEYNIAAGYATISAGGMESVIIPAHVEHVIIVGDNDCSFTGQKAAFTLARRMDQEKRRVTVRLPMDMDYDFNDLHNESRYDWSHTILEFENDR